MPGDIAQHAQFDSRETGLRFDGPFLAICRIQTASLRHSTSLELQSALQRDQKKIKASDEEDLNGCSVKKLL